MDIGQLVSYTIVFNQRLQATTWLLHTIEEQQLLHMDL